MDTAKLETIARQMVAPGKGIIAADESSSTCQKRFDSVGVECTEENRRIYRQLILAAPGVEEAASGVILYDETIRQKADDGTPFAEVLAKKGILPGIKVDKGAKPLALHEGEKVTEGLDGLRDRLAEYAKLGATFAKWRAVITIGQGIPSDACLSANAHAMARYAALAQEAGIVPIVEPEVLMDGDHSIETSYEVTAKTLKAHFAALAEQGVYLPGTILKASMVIAGKNAAAQSTAEEVAKETVRCLKENVPAELTGVVFLSGGQSDEQATENLDAMNKLGGTPWPLSFSYGRAIQQPALKIWSEDIKANVAKASEALVFRTKMNGLAAKGEYSSELEKKRPY